MENEAFFCGLAVVTMGDFFQLPPVRPAETFNSGILSLLEKKISLNTENTATGPRYVGISLFKTFQKIKLTEEMRAADDFKRAEFLNQLRSSTTSTAISNESLSVLKSLTKEDIEKNNSWTQATIFVTSNEERCRINEQQSKAV